MNGAEIVCRTLEELGADTVFGLPGSQNVALFEALRTSHLRTIVATHELGAAFMANGYARASGRPGILTTIPGPGFTYALTGLAEARLDSAPLLHVLVGPASAPGRRFQLQALDQSTAAAPFVKRVLEAETAADIAPALREAHALSLAGEPGPVVVQIAPQAFGADTDPAAPAPAPVSDPAPDLTAIERRLCDARRPLFYLGQGAFGAAEELRHLVEALGAPAVTTTSARGVIPEDHRLVLRFDRRRTEDLNTLVAESDLVLALGVKFSHNGAHGFRLQIPPERLVHVDASAEVLGANFDASLTLAADVPTLVRGLLEGEPGQRLPGASGWAPEDLKNWKKRTAAAPATSEPRIRGQRPGDPSFFFAALRKTMARDSFLALDSGLHQMLARRHFSVLCPRGLLLPTDLQSMGFAIPAAIGAQLAVPERPTVALVGDGGFAISALELLTAVREGIPLKVIVFNDGRFGLILKQQLASFGEAHGTQLRNPDIRKLTESVGARYLRFQGDPARCLAVALRGRGVTVLEVLVADRGGQHLRRVRQSVASRFRRWVSRRQP